MLLKFKRTSKKYSKYFIIFSLIALISCGGDNSSSSDDYSYSDPDEILMTGVWTGNFVLQRNECNLNLVHNYNFINSVWQYEESIDLEDEEGMRFTGSIVGDTGFSVDRDGPENYQVGDGRFCDFTFRYRYESINSDYDRTAKARFLYIGSCSDGTECTSEYSGDAMRD